MTLELQKILDDGVASGVYPNAELLGAKGGKIDFHLRAGDFSKHTDPVFDLASLTKPICTALVCMLFSEEGKLDLTDSPKKYLGETVLDDVTIASLLNHTSGLTDWAPLYAGKIAGDKIDFEKNRHDILELILNDDYFLRNPDKVVYSDIGYIILGEILEKIAGKKLNEIFLDKVASKLKLTQNLFFVPLTKSNPEKTERFLPSEICPFRKRVIQGEVMDKNCFAIGGVAGHAGLFGDAKAVHVFLSELNKAKSGVPSIINKKTFETFCLPDPDRVWENRYFTLGFDTNTKGVSQSGSLFSKNTIGHLGYTGTSFWWDLERDFWVILLTNRTMPERKNFKIQKLRPVIHDAAVRKLTSLQT